MNIIKSLYVSLYLTAAVVLTLFAAVQMWQAGSLLTPWLGALIAGAAPTVYFLRVFLTSMARTAPRLWGVLAIGAVGALLALALGGGLAALLAALVGVVGTWLYDTWYSRFEARDATELAVGNTLPAFVLSDAQGQLHRSTDLTSQPTVWMFYRGNWCPFCMAQIREIAGQYRELEQRGVQVILISPQSAAHTRSLARKFEVPMKFLVDEGNRAARTLGVFAENGLPAGMQALGYDSDVPMPTVFITAAGGRILYADLTDNYRIRPEPDAFLQVLDQAQVA